MSFLPDNIKSAFGRDIMRLDIITENLANSQTHGYRATRFSSRSFQETLNQRVVAKEMATDFTQGSYIATERPLDAAIHGDGFFVVRSKDNSEYLTRNGSFELNAQGELVNSAGFNVIGRNGPVTIPLNQNSINNITISENGVIRVDQQEVAKLSILQPDRNTDITRVGPTMFAAKPDTRLKEATGTVQQRTLESSNTSVFEEMAELISLTKGMETSQRILKSEDNSIKKLIQSL